ncbi:MAG: HAMP domain-containing protein, partial [Chloroflexi bacterium]|nr:HAMP domain-containing protein [Chloroflexota bacterium]
MRERLSKLRPRPFRWLRAKLSRKQRGRRVSPKKLRFGDELVVIKAEQSRLKWARRPLHFFWRVLRWTFQLLRRAWRGFRWMTRSLWFRLMGAFAVVIFLMLFIVMNVVGNITARAFSQYVDQRNDYVRTILPSFVDSETLDGAEVVIAGDQIIIRPTLPQSPTSPQPPILPDLPALPDVPEIVIELPEIPTVETVIEEEVIVLPLIDLLAPNSPEALGLSFLTDVQEAAETAVIAAGIVSLILGTLLFWQITRPMSQMRRASQALAAGEANVRVPVRSQDELGKVAEAFNQMAGKISEQEQLRRRMVADVAHELRTPLTVMKANLEAMLDGLLTPNEAEIRELHEETQRLSRLIDDLRLLSLADSGQLSLTLHEVDVRELTATVVARLAPLAESKVVKLVDDAPAQPLIIMADADRVQQALTNLVANGVRHTPAGGRVRVTAVQEKQTIHLSVIDSGPGISPADLPNVFDRFWRGD